MSELDPIKDTLNQLSRLAGSGSPPNQERKSTSIAVGLIIGMFFFVGRITLAESNISFKINHLILRCVWGGEGS